MNPSGDYEPLTKALVIVMLRYSEASGTAQQNRPDPSEYLRMTTPQFHGLLRSSS
jgi:hypothetical protein